jgi:hypothetical protein
MIDATRPLKRLGTFEVNDRSNELTRLFLAIEWVKVSNLNHNSQ